MFLCVGCFGLFPRTVGSVGQGVTLVLPTAAGGIKIWGTVLCKTGAFQILLSKTKPRTRCMIAVLWEEKDVSVKPGVVLHFNQNLKNNCIIDSFLRFMLLC